MSRTVIITGGSSGIGKAIGAALVARGDDVVLAARTEADVRRAAGELSAQGPGQAQGAVLDVRNVGEVADLVNDVYRSVIETPLLDKGGLAGLPSTPRVFADARGLMRHATRTAPYPAARLAREVLRDLDEDRAIIVRPSSARWLWRLYRLSPRIAEAYGRSYVRWATEHMAVARVPEEVT
jgi:NAD(P)-dependent dehydrogenase (short-subunit alcohol dehydrogenase family)